MGEAPATISELPLSAEGTVEPGPHGDTAYVRPVMG